MSDRESIENINVRNFHSSNINLKDGSTQNIKAKIFGENVEEDSTPVSHVASSSSVTSYGSQKGSKVSVKSGSFTRFKGSIQSQDSTKFVEGSAESYDKSSMGSSGSKDNSELFKGSEDSARSKEFEQASVGTKDSTISPEDIRGSNSYGSAGSCKTFDSIDLNEPKQISFISSEIVSGKSGDFSQKSSDEIGEVRFSQDSKSSIENNEIPSKIVSSPIELAPFSPDDEYLKKHLGVPLTHALLEISIRQPEDPIHYLGHWLFKWRWNQEWKQHREDEINELTIERQRTQEEIEEKIKLEAERKAREEAQQIATEDAQAILDDVIEKTFQTIEEEEASDSDFQEETKLESSIHQIEASQNDVFQPSETDTGDDSEY